MKRMLVGLVALAVAAGCAGGASEGSANAEAVMESPAEAVVLATAEVPASVAGEAPAGGAADSPAVSPDSPAEVPADATGEVSADSPGGAGAVTKTDFVATDPATIQLAAGKPQLVEFYATWCIVCRAQMPIIHGLEAEFGSEVNFVFVDIDDPASAELKAALGYTHQPDYFLLDGDGNVVTSWLGTLDATEVRRAISGALSG